MNTTMSTRNAVETAIDLSKMSGTWEYLIGLERKRKLYRQIKEINILEHHKLSVLLRNLP